MHRATYQGTIIPDKRRRSSEAGFVEHLVKPVELARLLQLIHTLIQN